MLSESFDFSAFLRDKWREKAVLALGLDVEPTRISRELLQTSDGIMAFIDRVLAGVKGEALCAVKINPGYFLPRIRTHGEMEMSEAIIGAHSIDLPVIFDDKRGGDISETNARHVSVAFDVFNCQAVTILPNFEEETAIFGQNPTKGVFVVAMPSKGGQEFHRRIQAATNNAPAEAQYKRIARDVMSYGANWGITFGGGHVDELIETRSLVGANMPFLITGIGAQGGDIKSAIRAGMNSKGGGVIIPLSRSILYPKEGVDPPLDITKNVRQRFRHWHQLSLYALG